MARFGVKANLTGLLASPKVSHGPNSRRLRTSIKGICLINYKFSKEVCLVRYSSYFYHLIWVPTKHPEFHIIIGYDSNTYICGGCCVKIKPTYIDIQSISAKSYRLIIDRSDLDWSPIEKFYAKYYDQIQRTPANEVPYLIFRIDREYQNN